MMKPRDQVSRGRKGVESERSDKYDKADGDAGGLGQVGDDGDGDDDNYGLFIYWLLYVQATGKVFFLRGRSAKTV